MNPIIPGQFSPMMPQPWTSALPSLPPLPPPSSAFWNSSNVCDHLRDLSDTFDLAKAVEKELETLIEMKNENGLVKGDSSIDGFCKLMEDNRINLEFQKRISLEAVNALISRLRDQLEPFRVVADEKAPWEEKSAAVRLANKMQKYKRNKLWRKRKRKQIAEKLAKERDQFEQVDKEADEWRAREIAKDVAKQKVEKMKEIAKLKAKEERKRLESELEMMLIVEKLQELRSIRIQKLKKQGHFLPEEDDKFLERVRAAVEEEERQALAAADTEAAKDAIATAEVSRTSIQSHAPDSEEHQNNKVNHDHLVGNEEEKGSIAFTDKECGKEETKAPTSKNPYDSVSNLPMEFYHYYYGSNTDMGTLIEVFFWPSYRMALTDNWIDENDTLTVLQSMQVRRMWDAYIRPGGSRIPGHWVQPPPPSDEIWASYLKKSQ